ncbi:MAG: CRISPR-associated helicase Cas3', partial [Acidobacteria bacterium]|nr:CRISPR-associated helicase Cas3' [Acidobacteriota bacterium]
MPVPNKRRAPSKSEQQTAPRHEHCWAKTTKENQPGISVRDHCLNVGCVAEALLDLLPPALRGLLPPKPATLAALHDVGKVSAGFQAKCEAWLVSNALTERALGEGWRLLESDHARISQYTVQGLLHQSRLHRWAAILGAHHGKIKGERVHLREPWEDERRRLSGELIREFGPLPDCPPAEAMLWFLAGLVTIADWIGSDENRFPQDAQWDMAARREHVRVVLKAIAWTPPSIDKGFSFGDLFHSIARANSLQDTISQAVEGPGVYVIEAPMGYGKTEAALAAAYRLLQAKRATGLYFALPTQVTSNRIYIRMQPFVQRICSNSDDVRLAHSASWLFDTSLPPRLNPASRDAEAEAHARAGRSWFASPKRALLAPFGVGTVDQALLGIVAANHFFVRQFGLAGKVVVLDEVHTYDLYTSTLIDTLVRRLRELQCTVIILSATLTEKRRRELLCLSDDRPVSAAYPLISGGDGMRAEWPCDPPAAKTVQIRCVSGDDLVDGAIERAHGGQCVLWIRNTVDDAQEIYRVLKSASVQAGPPIALLHSRFPFFRREELEAEWMDRLGKDTTRRPRVSTQVAEQSVDIDADMLITDLAPTDMLLQRLGRLWRHERSNRPCARPEAWILVPPASDEALRNASEKELHAALGKSGRVYAPYVLLRSLEQWSGRAEIVLPADIRPILEATYCDPPAEEPDSWRRLRVQLEHQKEKMANLAISATRIWTNPALDDEDGVQTRYGSYPMANLLLLHEVIGLNARSVRLRLPNGHTTVADESEWNLGAAKAIYRNLVPVPRWTI